MSFYISAFFFNFNIVNRLSLCHVSCYVQYVTQISKNTRFPLVWQSHPLVLFCYYLWSYSSWVCLFSDPPFFRLLMSKLLLWHVHFHLNKRWSNTVAFPIFRFTHARWLKNTRKYTFRNLFSFEKKKHFLNDRRARLNCEGCSFCLWTEHDTFDRASFRHFILNFA